MSQQQAAHQREVEQRIVRQGLRARALVPEMLAHLDRLELALGGLPAGPLQRLQAALRAIMQDARR